MRHAALVRAALFWCMLIAAPSLAAADERADALARDPATLPHAAPGLWDAWTPDLPPPEALRAVLARAGQALEHGDYPLALAALFEALELAPGYPPALHQVGAIYFRLQRYGDAVVAFERFLAVAPARVGETRGLAHGLYSLGHYEEALAHYERVLGAAPGDIEALRGLALCHMRLGSAARALELLERALELDPGHAEAALWRARILYDEEQLEQALAAATRARELDPFDPRPWFLLGRILLELGREEDGQAARARFEELDRVAQEARILEHRLLYDPAQVGILGRLVDLYRSIGDVGRTREALARMVRERPRELELRVYALDVLEALGDKEGARVAAVALEQSCAERPEAWKRLERYYALHGDRRRQVECGERYLRLGGR